MPIENWTISREEIDKALELQRLIKEAGLSWPQVDILLDMKEGTVHEYCRGHARVQPQIMSRIKEILEKVKAGKIKPPILDRYREV